MRLLLDSHTLLWAEAGDPRLSARAKRLLANQHLWFSVASLWELAIKAQTRGLSLPESAARFVQRQVVLYHIELLPITVRHVAEFERLPLHHRDPFDRMLIAQARSDHLTLLSADSLLRQYDVEVVW